MVGFKLGPQKRIVPYPDSSRGPNINVADLSNADGSSNAGGLSNTGGLSNAAGSYNAGGMSNTTGTFTNTGYSNVAGISNAGGAANAVPAAFANNPQPAYRPAMNLSRRFPTAPGVSSSLTPATAELLRADRRTPQVHTEMCAVEAENAKDTHGGMLPAAFELYKGPDNLSGIGLSGAETLTHDLPDGLPGMDGQKLPLADFLQLISWERLNNILECCDATDPRKIKLSLLRADACISREDVLGAELVYLDLWHGIASAGNSSEATDHVEGLINVGMQYADFLMTYNRKEEARNVLLVLWSSIESRQSDWISSELLVRIADMAKELGLSHVSMGALKSSLDLLKAQDPDSYTVHSLETLVDAGINESLRSLPPRAALPTNVELAARRMFDARVSAKTPIVDDSLVELCRSLTNNYASQGEWNELKTVANALLRIAWPAVTDDSSTVIDGAASVAGLQDVAMSAAEGHEKTQEPGLAGSIYQRIVQLAQDPSVSDPDLTSKAAQEALRIYERLGQVDKTNETLQSLVSYYLLTRGEENPLTIETSYKLARTCLQDGQVDNAVHHFQRIAICLEQPEYQDQRAIPALKALLVIHRGRKDWDQARSIYESLWQTFLHKGRDYGIRRETGKKLFTEYSQLLESQLGADSRTLHQLAEEYRQRCESVFGDQDVASIDAAMMLAESWEGIEVNSENALRIYEDVHDEFGDIDSTSRIDLIPFVEAAKSALLKYYTRRLRDPMSRDRLTRATEASRIEYHRCFAQAGYTSAQTLKSLGSWVFLLTKARTQEALQEATEQLQEAVTVIWESEPEPTVLYEAALALASWYLDCDLVSEATDLINDLRKKLIFSLAPSDKNPIQEAARPSLASSLFFLTAFETRLTGTMMSFANTHSQALLESGFWRSFQELKGQTSLAGPALVSGAKLWALLNGRNTTSNAWLERQLYDVFMKNFGASFPLGTQTPMGFFLVLLRLLSGQRPDADLPHLSCAAIASHVKSLLAHDDLQGVLDVFGPDFDFGTYVDAYSSESMIEQGFQLASALAGLNPKNASNSALSTQVLGVGKRIMHALLQMCRERQLTLDNIAIDHLLELASVLGQQENFEDLEWLLHKIWMSRQRRGLPSQDLIVKMGHGLADVRFYHHHAESAIDLARDILHNVRHAYGPSHHTSIEMTELLSSMYFAKGDQDASLAVFGNNRNAAAASYTDQISHSNDPNITSSIAQSSGQPTTVFSSGVGSMRAKVESLLRSYQRGGSVIDDKGSQQPENLMEKLSKQLESSGGSASIGRGRGTQQQRLARQQQGTTSLPSHPQEAKDFAAQKPGPKSYTSEQQHGGKGFRSQQQPGTKHLPSSYSGAKESTSQQQQESKGLSFNQQDAKEGGDSGRGGGMGKNARMEAA